jgi:uncharacterized protein YjiS (DUF1127 family)
MTTTNSEVAATQAFGASVARKGLDAVATGILTRIGAAIAAELRVRRDMKQLMAMDEDMLADIGLTRADIRHAVRYGRN